MKKVLLTGAALMLVGGIVATEKTYAAEPGVKITGDARVRLWYMNDAYDFNDSNAKDSETTMDSRVRLNITGTAAGGSYASVRIRMMENKMGDMDADLYTGLASTGNDNIWVDKAYVGIPFNDTFTLEVGKYRSTYGPLAATYNFFYDDVNLTGMKGIVKLDNIEINPFIEWMEEAQTTEYTGSTVTNDANDDNDEIRFGAHVKAKLNKDWTVGGMLGYQTDSREEYLGFKANEGFFGSLYAKGQNGPFGIYGELAVTDGDLNGFNYWTSKTADTNQSGAAGDLFGSDDTGFGGYVVPNYQIDKLNIGLNLGFTSNGFMPDNTFGFVMLGGADNSKLSDYSIGASGDWMWAGLVATYQIAEDLKLTGNLVYADVDAWSIAGVDGPLVADKGLQTLDSAWELSAVLQYTISKGADVYFSAGMLSPEMHYANAPDDTAFGALTRFELKF
ncbi:MAG: hypothetical protein PHI97_10315 [Desulfobulbus sp.]|nr:hypothetical protein [Desulfobulbus sp.]